MIRLRASSLGYGLLPQPAVTRQTPISAGVRPTSKRPVDIRRDVDVYPRLCFMRCWLLGDEGSGSLPIVTVPAVLAGLHVAEAGRPARATDGRSRQHHP